MTAYLAEFDLSASAAVTTSKWHGIKCGNQGFKLIITFFSINYNNNEETEGWYGSSELLCVYGGVKKIKVSH